MKLRKVFILLAMVLCTVLLAGCSQEQTQNNQRKDTVSSSSQAVDSGSSGQAAAAKTMTIKVYYPDTNAMGLVAIEKTVKATDSEKYKAAVETLLAGTEDPRVTEVFPKKTKLKNISVSGDTVKVDFDSTLTKNFAGGSTGEEMLVGSLVNTLTEFPEIKNVQLLVEGKTIESLAGHMDLSKPVQRMDELITK